GYLAAAGFAALHRGRRRGPWIRRTVDIGLKAAAFAIVVDLGLFAGAYLPYIPPELATLEMTPSVRWLREQPGIFRIAPTFPWLVPNQAELTSLEDIRSRGARDPQYDAMLRRIDPAIPSAPSAVVLSSQSMNFNDPLLSMINARYVIEPPPIDIIRWGIYEKSRPSATPTERALIPDGARIVQQVDLPADPIHSIEFTLSPRTILGAKPRVEVSLRRPESGEVIAHEIRTLDQLRFESKIYLPLRNKTLPHQSLLAEIAVEGMVVASPQGIDSWGRRQLVYGLVGSPLVYVGQWEDGRIFENVRARERFFAAWDLREVSFEEMIQDTATPWDTALAVPGLNQEWRDRLAAVAPSTRGVAIAVESYGPSRIVVRTRSEVPFFLASSETMSDDLRMEIDGRRIEPARVNGLFVGAPMDAGEHRVAISRRIGRGWWPVSLASGLMLIALAARSRLAGRRG
ncbi:MAG TPA: hypothetical protein VM534_03615, partial [Thermoanaerobaculia bacterium]|nr:hypothetical protein [Thermoanaerobaculia bacterium]